MDTGRWILLQLFQSSTPLGGEAKDTFSPYISPNNFERNGQVLNAKEIQNLESVLC